MNRILVYKSYGRNAWMAQFIGPHSEEIMRLFNTEALPLPFTLDAPLTAVLREVQTRNPNVLVEW